MDHQTAQAVLQWRAQWSTVTLRMRRAVLQNQGDYPRLVHAHEAGSGFLETTVRLSPILPRIEVHWALLYTRFSLEQVRKAMEKPDTTVNRQFRPPLTKLETGGRERVEIDRRWLEIALDLARPSRVAKELGVSPRTVRREMLRHGLCEPGEPPFLVVTREDGSEDIDYRHPRRDQCPWTDAELDRHVGVMLSIFPLFGRSMAASFLRVTCGVVVTQGRLRRSLNRCAPQRSLGARYRIKRRVYSVAGPNALWHMDAQLGLRRFGIVIHGMCDGHTRLCTGIRASGNNRKATFMSVFEEAIAECGLPSRMRGDHGRENLAVSAYMELVRGSGRGSFLWGPSVHNIRIERLWVDVTNGFGGKWRGIFVQLEIKCGLDINNPHHIWLLHHLFLPLINRDAQLWRQTWNRHDISRLPNAPPSSPLALFFFGSMHHGVRGMGLAHDDQAWQDAGGAARAGNTYGVDWDEIDNHPHVVSHRQDARPDKMAEVVVDDPSCPLTAEEVGWIDAIILQLQPAIQVTECMHRWQTGLDAMELIVQNRINIA